MPHTEDSLTLSSLTLTEVFFLAMNSCLLFWSLLHCDGVFLLFGIVVHIGDGDVHCHGEVEPGIQVLGGPAGAPAGFLREKVRESFPSLDSMDRLTHSLFLLWKTPLAD